MPGDKEAEMGDSGQSDVFDLDRIRKMIELMKEHDLSEVDLRQASQRIRLRRGSDQPVFTLPATAPAASAAPPVTASPAAAAPPEIDNATYITCPMVGTFYSRPKPDAPSFVKVGDFVEADTVVCLVEAMKMFNEIPAGIAGRIVEVLVKNEEAVDVNRRLFRIEPA